MTKGIKSFRNKYLEELSLHDFTSRIDPRYHSKIKRILDYLKVVDGPEGFGAIYNFHPLKGNRKGTYAVTVSRNWRITFRFDEEGCVTDVDFEDYH